MKQFDDIIQEKAHSHEAPVPANAWENIDKKKRKRRRGFFWWTLCGLLLLGTATIVYITDASKQMNEKTRRLAGTTVDANKITTDQSIQNNTTLNKDNSPAGNDASQPIAANTDANQPAAPSGQKNTPVTSEPQQPVQNNSSTAASTNDPVLSSTAPVKNHADKIIDHPVAKTKTKTAKNKPNEGDDYSLAAPKKISGKTKAKSNANIVSGETGIDPENKDKALKPEVADLPTIEKVDKEKVIEKQETAIVDKIPAIQAPVTTPVTTVDSLKKLDEKKNKDVITTIAKKKDPEKKKTKKINPWFVDFSVIPLLPVQEVDQPVRLNRTLITANSISLFNSTSVQSKLDPSAAFSLSLKKKMGPRLFIGLGLQYVELKEKINIKGNESKTTYSVIDVIVNGVSGPELIQDTVEALSTGEREINGVNSYRLLSIPVFVQYNLVQKKHWSFGIIGGGYVNISSTYQDEISRKAAAPLLSSTAGNRSNTGFDLYGGLRFGVMVSKRIELFALPSGRWNLGGYKIKKSLCDQKINLYGLGIGASFKLN